MNETFKGSFYSEKSNMYLLLLLLLFDLSFASTETKFQNPITKTQNNFLVKTVFLVKLFQKKPK